jgi:hypothetical protein
MVCTIRELSPDFNDPEHKVGMELKVIAKNFI